MENPPAPGIGHARQDRRRAWGAAAGHWGLNGASLQVVSLLPNADQEFTVQEMVACSKNSVVKAFTPSHVSQMLSVLAENGLVYKNRHGKYWLAVPLLGQFIQRQTTRDILLKSLLS